MFNLRQSNTVRLAPLAVALSVAAVACGGSDKTTATTAPAAPAVTAAPAASADTMSEMSDTMHDTMSETMVEPKNESAMEDTMHETMSDSMTGEWGSETMSAMTGDAAMHDSMTGDAMSSEMSGPAFLHLKLVDTAGQEFTLGDMMGKPVFVENFATWCPKCKSQLKDTNAAAGELGADATFVALSIETQLSSADVAKYAADNGFTNVRFAVMTPEFLAAVNEQFGGNSANAPSTPHFIIDSHGMAGELKTGSESSSDIVAAVKAAG